LIKVLVACLLGTVAVGSFWLVTMRPQVNQVERMEWADVVHDWKESKRF
jgi:hypothetical protein